MKRKLVLTLFVCLCLPLTSPAGDGIREGQWEITTAMDMPGMPMKMPPTTIRHCYTKDEVKDQKKVISRDKNCTVTDLKSTGNKVTWSMKCSGKNAGTFTGETLFSGDSYDSVMRMKTEGGKGHQMTVKVKGKRIGNCP